MKNKTLTFCCLFALFVTLPCHGKGVSRDEYMVRPFVARNQLSHYQRCPQPELYAIGGDDFSVIVSSPMSPLDDLSIDFIQTGGGIAAKLKTDMTVSRHSYPLTTLYTISFKIPKVKKRMTAALKFRQKNADVDYGMIQMIIYPPEDKAVTGRAINQKLLENNMPCITVSDGHESHHVANFLAYRKANLSWVETASQPDTLTLVETTAKELKNLPSAASDRARVIVFVSDSDLPPGVYTTLTASGGALTKVTLPILSDLETNPRSCEIFLDLINQHLSRVMIVEN